MRIFSLSVKFVIYIEYKVVFNFMQEKSELFHEFKYFFASFDAT